MAYVPHLYVGVGAKTCFFTLRETYEKVTYIERVPHYSIESVHLCNLSQDATEAIEKATRYAAEAGYVLASTVESIAQEMNAISRANAEEMEARERERKARLDMYAEERALEALRMREVIAAGFFPCTKYQGVAFDKAERGFVRWVAKMRSEFEEGSIMRAIADEIVTNFAHLLAADCVVDLYVGEAGKRMTFNVDVLRVMSFDGFYGRTHIVIMRDDSGACVVSKGSFYAEVGDKLTIKATIKEHDEYKGQAQTRVMRVKILEEIAK